MGEWVELVGPERWSVQVGGRPGTQELSRKLLLTLKGDMVGLRWALRRLGQQGILNSSRGLSKSKREVLESRLQLLGREYSSAGRGIGVWGACFDGGQPHEVLTFEN